MSRILLPVLFVTTLGLVVPVYGQNNGNPTPGYPHDTIIIHLMKGTNGPKLCDGGHSLFLREYNGYIPPTYVKISMIDWVQVDNDGDGTSDEDPTDGVDNDGDGLIDEDGVEPGAVTKALDCDSYGDGEVSLLMRDTDPRAGWVSTQKWYARLIGKPEQHFAFTSYANQTVSCSIDVGPDLTPGTADDVVTCVTGTPTDWVQLASFNLAALGCAKQVKLGGKNPVSGGGRTPFCDITDGFEVDVITTDTNGDGVIDGNDTPSLYDQFVFSVSCIDDPATVGVDETLYCPLSDIIWEVDTTNTTTKAKAQIFVGHTGSAAIKSGKLTKMNN